jgi:hypothetical protein
VPALHSLDDEGLMVECLPCIALTTKG